MYSCGHPGTFNQAVITAEAHMVYGNMNKYGEHTTGAGKKRSSHKISDYFSKNENLFSGE